MTAHSGPPDKDVDMESAEVESPMWKVPRGAEVAIFKLTRVWQREDAVDAAVPVPAVTAAVTKKVDGEGGAGFPPEEQILTVEYNLSISAKGENVMNEHRYSCGQSVYDVAEIFSPQRTCRRARASGLRRGL